MRKHPQQNGNGTRDITPVDIDALDQQRIAARQKSDRQGSVNTNSPRNGPSADVSPPPPHKPEEAPRFPKGVSSSLGSLTSAPPLARPASDQRVSEVTEEAGGTVRRTLSADNMRAPEEAPPDSKANTHSAKPSHTNLLASAAWAMLSAYNPSRARQYVVQDISYAESAEPDDDKVPSHKPNDALKDATTKVPPSLASSASGSFRMSAIKQGGSSGAKERDGHAEADDGAHEGGILSGVMAGLVCGLLFFVFSCVFASMLFEQNTTIAKGANELGLWVQLGPGTNTIAVMIGCLVFSQLSGSKSIIAGPDINPIVFFAEAITDVTAKICPELHDPDGVHGPEGVNPEGCDVEAVLPTVLASVFLGSLLVGLTFYLLGKFRLAGIVGFIPANVVSGFLSCIGWKVFKKALEVAVPVNKPLKLRYAQYYFGSWVDAGRFIVCSLPVGLPLYISKRYHLGKPTYVFPLFILSPVLIFYLALYFTGTDLSEARAAGWLYPEDRQEDFYRPWAIVYGGANHIDWSALAMCTVVWIVMLPIVVLDDLLKVVSSEAQLQGDFDFNREIKVGGVATMLSAVFIGVPTYGQTKFNVLAYGITHSTRTSIPTLVCGLFNGGLWLVGFPLINYLPRFLLGGLLLFSAIGFLIENLVDARQRFSRMEFACVWAVFIANVFAGEMIPEFGLLIAIVVGLFLSTFAFAAHFARKSDALNDKAGSNDLTPGSISGTNHASTAIRSPAQEMTLGIVSIWYHVIHAKGYVFFGTASKLYATMKAHLAEIKGRPACQRTKVLIWDMSEVYGIDATAGLVFGKVKRLAKLHSIQLVWAGISKGVEKKLRRACGVDVVGDERFSTLDGATKWVEDYVLGYAHSLAHRWIASPAVHHIYHKALLRDALTAAASFRAVSLGPGTGSRTLLTYASKVVVDVDEAVLSAGVPDDGLYLLFRGCVHVKHGKTVTSTLYPGAFFNEHVLAAPPGSAALYSAVAVNESAVMLRFSREQRDEMHWRDPHVQCQLLLAVFKQMQIRSNPHIEKGFEHISAAEAAIAAAAAQAASRKCNLRMSKAFIHVERARVRDEALKHLLEDALATADDARGARAHAKSGSDDEEGTHTDGRSVSPGRPRFVDLAFLETKGHRVALPLPMRKHFVRLFHLIDTSSNGEMPVADIEILMAGLGHQATVSDIRTIFADLGVQITSSVTEDAFLEFIRSALFADLRTEKVARIYAMFDDIANWRAGAPQPTARSARSQRVNKKQARDSWRFAVF
mmetsp:Transcript_37331/g.82110  ORF Transcript_37331/g.82110 Transcript_37331/m.82110 type:complete len:1254 (-) Transcript_37331:421-4182(-)